jgi:CBS domain containing-hemolysin-like protein
MMEHLPSLLLIFSLIFLNASFVAGEFAIARIRRTQIDRIADADLNDDSHGYSKGKIRTAKLLQIISLKINDYISACQIGITIASLALGAVAEAELSKIIIPLLENFNLPFDGHAVSIILSIAIITFFHVILGEVIPKNLAIINAEGVAFTLAAYLRFLYIIFKIPVKVLNWFSNLALKMLNIEENFEDSTHTEDELKLILSSSQAQGILEVEEEQIMQNVFDFNDTIAREVMVPRNDLFCLNANMTIEEAGKEATASSYSRFPVYEERMDNIIGYCSIKDILTAYQKNKNQDSIKTILNEILKVSDGMYVLDLLKLMQEKKKQMAILIDEFGGTCGLVTVEDIVEEIFGEIEDEEDIVVSKPFVKLDNGDILIDGLLLLDDVNEELGINLKSDHYDTVGGFVFGLIGTEPKVGDIAEFDGLKFRVEVHNDNRVRQVRFLK